MIKNKLKNGMKLLVEKRPSESVVVALQVNVGANNEDDGNRGISHFIEHMLFDGTSKRSSYEIGNEIERLGGELNAFTSHDRTVYYVVLPKKHFAVGLDVISDMIKNPKFSEEYIEKERRIIMDEANLTQDDPKFYQFILFLKNMYEKHPIRHPLYGYKETISRMSRNDILAYYNKYYVSNNMCLAIIGDVDAEIELIEKFFGSLKNKKLNRQLFTEEKAAVKSKTVVEQRKILHSYLVFGYKVPNRNDDDSYAIDVIRAILARGQSSKLFDELRIKRGLCYFVGGDNEAGLDYGYFTIYVGTDKKNIDEVVGIIRKEVIALRNVDKKLLDEAKTYIEGSFVISNEDPKKLAEHLLFWDNIDEKMKISDYAKKIKAVNRNDIINAARKYLGDNYVLAVVKQE